MIFQPFTFISKLHKGLGPLLNISLDQSVKFNRHITTNASVASKKAVGVTTSALITDQLFEMSI